MYQHLMDYWAETMQDDLYEIAADGWEAGKVLVRLTKKGKAKAAIKEASAALENKVIARYPKLSIGEIKTLTIEKKWLAAVEGRIKTELEAISHRLTERIKELAERYAAPLPELVGNVAALTAKVEKHLHRMGYKPL